MKKKIHIRPKRNVKAEARPRILMGFISCQIEAQLWLSSLRSGYASFRRLHVTNLRSRAAVLPRIVSQLQLRS